jgi:hypothetical protein
VLKNKVNIVITIEVKGEDGQLTASERWDVITAAAITVRAAIENYLHPKEHARARRAVASAILEPASARAKVTTRMSTAPAGDTIAVHKPVGH